MFLNPNRLLVLTIFSLFFLAHGSAFAWKRNPCSDPNAICKTRNGQRVCGYPGESFSTCQTGYTNSKKKIDLKELRSKAIAKCKAQSLYDYKQSYEGSPLQHITLQAIMKQCELIGWRKYTKE